MSLVEPCDQIVLSSDCLREEVTGISHLTSVQEWGASRLRAEWGQVLERFDDRLSLFQSPEWFDHINATEPIVIPHRLLPRRGRPALGTCPSGHDSARPGLLDQADQAGEKSPSPCWKFRACALPLPESVSVYDRLFKTLKEVARGYDGIYMRMLPTSSFCWRDPSESALLRSSFVLSLPEELTRNHASELPPTFEIIYGFQVQDAYNLRQRVKQLREHGGGELRLRRFEAPDEVDLFLELAALVASDPGRPNARRIGSTDSLLGDKLTDLAGRGLLRAYVLVVAGRPCVSCWGTRVTMPSTIIRLVDPSFANYSPGTVLHYFSMRI